jgi:ParB-like chromosome segregation protein Spo0J|tara:strand:+ start:313 stop:1017 length:705 start_codon:yes stop_codon:yes gene_type:complete
MTTDNTNEATHHAREDLRIKYVATDDLIPYINNSRIHSDKQISQIAASIKEFGWTNPLIVDGENGLIAGHGRLEAAKKLKASKVPVIELKDLSEAQKRAYVIADNRLTENSAWDVGLLDVELQALRDSNFDLSLTGFDAQSLEDLGLSFNEVVDFEETVYGMDNAENPAELKEAYEKGSIRQLILVFMQDEFNRVIDAMGEYAEKNGLANNTEVFIHLMESNGYAINTSQEKES